MSDISYKEFMETIKNLIKEFDINDYRSYILRMAEKAKPNERMNIINSLEYVEDYEEEITEKLTFQDDELIKDIQDLADRIDDDEFSEGYGWDSDYGDEREMGDESWSLEVDDLFGRAENQIYLEEYKVAEKAYEMLFDILEKDNLPCYEDAKSMVTVDLNKQASLYLRSIYLTSEPEERVVNIYEVMSNNFQYEAGKSVNIKGMIECGDELPELKDFLGEWIDYLMDIDQRFIGYLVREAILLYGGIDGLLKFAQENYERFPAAYVDVLLTLEKEDNKAEEIIIIAKEGLDKINQDYIIREELAEALVRAGIKTDNKDIVFEGMKASYYSKPSFKKFLELIKLRKISNEDLNELFDYAIKREEELQTHSSIIFWNELDELGKTQFSKSLLNDLYLFSGNIQKSYELCKTEPTISRIGYGRSVEAFTVSFMFRLLSKDNMKQYKNINIFWNTNLEEVKEELQDAKLFNFFVEEINSIIDTISLETVEKEKYEGWCTKIVSSTIDYIVGGQQRSEYDKAALLLVCCAEMLMNSDLDEAAFDLIKLFKNKYPRHRNFISSLNHVIEVAGVKLWKN